MERTDDEIADRKVNELVPVEAAGEVNSIASTEVNEMAAEIALAVLVASSNSLVAVEDEGIC